MLAKTAIAPVIAKLLGEFHNITVITNARTLP